MKRNPLFIRLPMKTPPDATRVTTFEVILWAVWFALAVPTVACIIRWTWIQAINCIHGFCQ
jgi:hypothetical protein